MLLLVKCPTFPRVYLQIQCPVFAVWLCVSVFVFVAVSPVFSQTSKPRAVSVCQLLTGAEIEKIVGQAGYDDGDQGDAPGEGIRGGSSCQFTGRTYGAVPGVGVALIPLKGAKSVTNPMRKASATCTREAVSGVGDAAFVELCTPGNPSLTFTVSGHDVIVIIEAKPPATPASRKPLLIELGRLAAAKLR